MVLRLYNSLSRAKEDFAPLCAPQVGLYTCGPTVYNYQHVGNYRTYIFEDVLVRSLKLLGYAPNRVMNITDVGHLTSQGDEGEDKMEVGAAREGKTAWEIAQFYTDAFLADCRALNLLAPDTLCRATDHIQEQIALVRCLEAKGFVYKISDGLYFDTAKFPDYGKLMTRGHLEGLKSGARVEANAEKKHITDFALWKFSPAGSKRQMEWNSPWGKGFPGWHIECSAMAMRFLGETFDIHCGGIDHVPVHHTNEIAQSEGATGRPFARFWMHSEFLLMNQAKMAKSSGGFIKLSDLKDKGFSPLDYRYHCFTAHYRKQLDFTWETLEGSKTSRRRLRDAALALAGEPSQLNCAEYSSRFKEALSDDLNMPAAMAVVWDALKSDLPGGAKKAFLEEAEAVLALDLFKKDIEKTADPKVAKLLVARDDARKRKDFPQADRIRQEIEAAGYSVEDGKDGAKAIKK
ncbi:MAG TPA: cysteine--tRNA ligase [Elusimicrobia bacterium]|nr:MAG: cysteine--tRNA ligase [Elusimicrobia bacterium GWA2_66_18]OGR76750.1 MAG: cysteine--tRNA ligase [Elusimicrobia bacterium GWC2_65_9]HAZ09118.1 cysteine--tRNA ligase [Elusimicrobiota bacterium]